MRSLIVLVITSTCGAMGLIDVVDQAKKEAWSWNAQEKILQSQQVSPNIQMASNLPSIQLKAAQSSFTSRSQQGSLDGNQSSLAAIYTVPLFAYQSLKAFNAAQSLADSQMDDYTLFQQSFVLDIVNRYFAVLNADKNLLLAKKNVDMNTKLTKDVEQKYQVGLLAMTDLAAARVGLDQAFAAKIKAENDLSVVKQQLTEMIQVEPDILSDIDLQTQLKFKPLIDPAAPNATLEKLKNLLLSAEYSVQSAKGAFLPTINATAAYNLSPINTNIQASASQISAGLSLQWNIYDGGASYANYERNCYVKQAAYAQLRQATLDLELSEKTTRQNLESADYQIQAQRQALLSAQIYLDAIRASFEAGQSTITDVLNAQKSLITQEQTLYSLLYNTMTVYIQLSQLLTYDDQSVLESLDEFLVKEWKWNSYS